MNRQDLKTRYLQAAENFRLLAAREEKLLRYISILRLLCFAGGILLIWIVFLKSILAGILLGPALIITFIYLLKIWSDHSDKKEFLGNLMKINLNEAEAISGKISQFEPGSVYTDASHDFSFDVDLFGESSIFQYLNRTVTGNGRDILAGWLSNPYLVSGELKSRQEVITELAKNYKWRHEFMATGMKIPLEKSHIAGLLSWMEEDTELSYSGVKKFLMWFLPSITILSLALLIAGILHYSVFIFIFLLNLLFIAFGLKTTNKIHNALSGQYSYLSSFVRLFKIFDNETFSSEGLKNIKHNLSDDRFSAIVSVKKLSRLIQSFDSRINIMVGFILNGLFLWDYHCINRLEMWKSENRKFFPQWLEMISTIDAYNSLAAYAYNNPEFVFPSISENSIIFSAKMLGHLLIDESKRICNDFDLEKSNICIVSGANMAGKSTFLRTVAVNCILAMTGAPVCATEMVFTPVKLFTSMRTTDSLPNNESYFYAELKRLKVLKTKIEEGEPVLFILDEILKGTNSADKSLGSKLFVKKIISLGGTGLIATHDISLGEMERENPLSIVNMCFEIEIEGESIRFEYKLRKGVTQKMNAALLMNQMGILE